MQQGWGYTQTMFDYKAARAGIRYIRVYAGGTSQICSKCGVRDPNSGYPRLNSTAQHVDTRQTRTEMTQSTSGTGDSTISRNVWGRPRNPSGWTAWIKPRQRVKKAESNSVPAERPSPDRREPAPGSKAQNRALQVSSAIFLTEVLQLRWPGLFRCSQAVPIRIRPNLKGKQKLNKELPNA